MQAASPGVYLTSERPGLLGIGAGGLLQQFWGGDLQALPPSPQGKAQTHSLWLCSVELGQVWEWRDGSYTYSTSGSSQMHTQELHPRCFGSVSQNELGNSSKIARPKSAADAASYSWGIVPDQYMDIWHCISLEAVAEYMLLFFSSS